MCDGWQLDLMESQEYLEANLGISQHNIPNHCLTQKIMYNDIKKIVQRYRIKFKKNTIIL